MKYIFATFLLLNTFHLFGQEPAPINHELSFQFDNDLLFFDAGDRYYTNGLFFTYIQKIKEDRSWSNLFGFQSLHKSIFHVAFVSKIFNPYNLKGEKAEEIDRPYAGELYVDGLYTSYWGQNRLAVGVDLGWLGTKTRSDDIQTNLHTTFGWVRPRGWRDYQIHDTPIAHLYTGLSREIVSIGPLSLISDVDVRVGTINTKAAAAITMRLGRSQPLDASVLTHARTGERIANDRKCKELFFVTKTQLMHVFYDATIEGNIIGEPSPFVKSAEPWVWMQSVGVMLSMKTFDLQALWSFLGREVVGGRPHKYGTLVIAKRF